MSFIYQSLSGLDTIGSGQLASNQRITLITAAGLVNATWGTLTDAIVAPLDARLTALENSGGAGGSPSIWPQARTLTLTGAVTGSVAMDGSQNVSLATAIADNSLPQGKVTGLTTALSDLGVATNNRWGTGYTSGSYPTAFSGNLNILTGAVYLYTAAGVTNAPATGGDQFTILQNGPSNYGAQLALRNGEGWLRGQSLGVWSGWNKLWTSANLDPGLLLLKTDVAPSATKLETLRTFALTGTVTATAVGFDGTGNVSLSTTIANNALTIAKTSGLQAALDSKFQFGNTIPVSTALNSLTTSGYYNQTTTGDVTPSNNYPVTGVGGLLNVVTFGTRVLQEYLTTTNQLWRRLYDGTGWTIWARVWDSAEFDYAAKYDKTGGAISGWVSIGNTLTVSSTAQASGFIGRTTPDTNVSWLIYNNVQADRHLGIGLTSSGISLRTQNAASTDVHELKLLNAGGITYDGNAIYHAGNFVPSNPVPAGGLLNIGDPSGTHLRFRNDGQYSTNGGSTWREINEAPQVITDPAYSSVTIGADSDIKFYEDTTAGSLMLRTGSAAAYKYFTFHANGNLLVPDGRVLIGGNEAWHAGNFDPNTKLGSTANAVSATKLLTARTINGVLFDGTSNITITAEASSIPWGSITSMPPIITTLGNLANSSGWLRNNGAGTLSYTTPTKSDVGLGNVDNTADSSKAVASAAVLTTARTINGTSFNGSVNITTANWGTARTLTVGGTGKSVDGSGNVSWSLAEIGAQAALGFTPLNKAGDTATGALGGLRLWSGWDSGTTGSISCSNWFRASGQTGFYCQDYGSGIYMTDTTYVRTYNGKAFSASDFVISSDERLKEELGPLTFRHPLRPILFRWLETGEIDLGFGANEVSEHYPEVVGEIEKQGGLLDGQMIKQLSYHKLTAVLAAQANEQDDKIVALTREVAELKQMVADLLNR